MDMGIKTLNIREEMNKTLGASTKEEHDRKTQLLSTEARFAEMFGDK